MGSHTPSKQEYTTVDCPTLTLNTGAKMPVIGLGTWKAKPGVVGQAVKDALYAGYRHIDCASAYGNQDEVGAAMAEIFAEGKIKREDVFITSKLFNSEHGDEQAAAAKTLKDLQLDYLDLYLVHWPVSGKFEVPTLEPPMTETWAEMEKLHKAGKAKAIGISNFSVKKTQDLLSYAKVKPAVQQIERHPYWRNQACVDFCKKHDMVITAYSPLGSPDSLSTVNRHEDVPVLMDEPKLLAIADKLKKNKGQVLIKYCIQSGIVAIPKSVNKDRITGNLHVIDWELPAEDFKTLDTLDFQARMLDGASVANINPKGPYKTLDELWDGELSDYNREMAAKAK